MNRLRLDFTRGKLAPHYPDGIELQMEGVMITEQGTEANLPIVDFKMRGRDGQLYIVVMTGRMINMISAGIRGSNLRNHGREEP